MTAAVAVPVGSLLLNPDEVKAVRHALLIGLDSYGEIERLTNEVEFHKMRGGADLGELRPLHPTGSAHTVGDFAAALRFLES